MYAATASWNRANFVTTETLSPVTAALPTVYPMRSAVTVMSIQPQGKSVTTGTLSPVTDAQAIVSGNPVRFIVKAVVTPMGFADGAARIIFVEKTLSLAKIAETVTFIVKKRSACGWMTARKATHKTADGVGLVTATLPKDGEIAWTKVNVRPVSLLFWETAEIVETCHPRAQMNAPGEKVNVSMKENAPPGRVCGAILAATAGLNKAHVPQVATGGHLTA